MILDSRKNPPRSSTIERKNYNLHALSQNCVSKPLTQVSTVKDKVPITIDLTETDSVDENDPIQKIYINRNDVDEDIQCDICLDFEHEDDDQIVLCDLCNVATHQSCYGGDIKDNLPTGNWYCQRCQMLLDNRSLKCTQIRCFLCDEIDGVMKCID
jgi:hypothetical protein